MSIGSDSAQNWVICQCGSFLLHPIVSQRWFAWKRVLLRLLRRIQSYQRRFSSVEVEVFRAARLSNSTGRPGVLVSYKISSRSRQMGNCMPFQGNSKDYAANASISLKRRKREAIKLTQAGEAGSLLHQMPQKKCGNGASNMACLYTQQGRKGVNQDAMIVWENFGSQEDTIFCGVFDGHGPHGHLVAQIVRDSLPEKLLSNWQALKRAGQDPPMIPDVKTAVAHVGKGPGSLDSDMKGPENGLNLPRKPESFVLWKESILKAYKLMDKELRVKSNVNCYSSGTTAVTLVKQGKDLIIGNVGDSRAVLGTKSDDDSLMAVQLTVDLKPNLPQEAERIRQCKGRVFALHDEPEVQRVWLPHNNSPGLAMARAFGDFCLKNFGLIAVPNITCRQLTERDQFIVLATDGIWDVLSNKQVVQIVSSVSVRNLAAKAVVDTAVHVWRSKYSTSRVDDCAVVCLFVDDLSTISYGSVLDSISSSKARCSLVAQTLRQVEPVCQSVANGRLIKDSSAESISVSQVVDNENKQPKPSESQGVAVSQTEYCSALENIMRVNSLFPIAEHDDNLESQSTPAELKGVGDSETENWLAPEGVARVDSLVNLPRFSPDGSRTVQ